MRILGVDPGTATTGFGVLESPADRNQARPKVIDFGVITTPETAPMPQRLHMLANDLNNIIKTTKPDWLAVEQLFFTKNVTTGIAVGQARGVVLLCAAQANLSVAEYTPPQVKQAVTGQGNAPKKQVQQMVKVILGLKTLPKPDDAADALALAICHAAAIRWQQPHS